MPDFWRLLWEQDVHTVMIIIIAIIVIIVVIIIVSIIVVSIIVSIMTCRWWFSRM